VSFPEEIDGEFESGVAMKEDDLVAFADGSEWLVSRGKDAPTLSTVFRSLGLVRKLYQQKFGYVDSNNDDDFVKFRDGSSWLVSRGWGEPPAAPAIEQSIKELKATYQKVFDDEVDIVDDEFVTFADGSSWTVTHGVVAPTLASLEEQLAEVWDLYIDTMLDDADSIMLLFGSYGQKTTTRNKRVKLADGSSWDVLRGKHPPTLESLEEKVADVKQLFEKMQPDSREPARVTKPTSAMLRAASIDGLPARHGIFDAAQFGRATRSDLKAKKKDWMLQRNQAPVLDSSQLRDVEALTKHCDPTLRYYPEPTNGTGRKIRRSAWHRRKLLREESARAKERCRRNQDKQLSADRKRKLLADPE
jgi:hypothetical protein